MGRRTVQSSWKQFEKFSLAYLSDNSPESNLKKLNELSEKVNNDVISDNLVTLFVHPHLPLDLKLVFQVDFTDGEISQWQTNYDNEASTIYINPLAIFKYIQSMDAIVLEEDEDESFLHIRYIRFMKEMIKMPSIYMLFLNILQRVAYLKEIAHLEKRGGVIEVAEGEAYLTYLWGFKELEQFVLKTQGVNVRAEYGIFWYESDWITGR